MKRFVLFLSATYLSFGLVLAQQTVGGTVIDAQGETLIGATVLVKGTSTGTVTDVNGEYSITVPDGSSVLTFSYTGYEPQEIEVAGRSFVNVELLASTEVLSEVVYTAFGITTKEAFSGSADVVSSKELESRTVTSPIEAIEGKATGVQFTSASGGPGSSPGIVIRGVGTLNGDTDPLYIVDGVQFEGALNNINQEDVASITVLKDASSTALYGSRGANGVVLITTKRGNRTGKTSVSASVQHGVVDNAIPFYDEVTPGQYYETMWEALRNSTAGKGDPQFASANIFTSLGYNPFDVPNDQIVGVDGRLNPEADVVYNSLNWYDFLERDNARRSNYNVNVASGGEGHSVFFSSSYLQEDGYIKTSEYDRFTSRVNADFDANNWLTLGGSANVTLSNSAGPSSAGTNSIVNPFGFAKNIGSIYPVFVNDREGNFLLDAGGDPVFDSGEGFPAVGIGSRPISQGRHALQELILNDERDRDNTYGFRFYGTFHLFPGLDLTLNYGRDINEGLEKEYENNIIGDAQPTGRYSETRFRRQVINFNQLLNYRTQFGGLHNVELTAGHESFDRNFTSNNAIAVDQTAEGIYEFANFATPVSVGGATTVKRIEGYFGRANYDFDNRYYLSASVRRDGSSVFSQDARWGTFYSVGASWRITNEAFMPRIGWLSNLKLRASYGEVGNDDLNDFFLSQARYDLNSNAGNPAIIFSEIGNQRLQWETIESFDVALEYGLFDGVIDGSIEYYRRNSSDLLYNLPIALSNGANAFPANVGDMYNSGLELGLTYNVFRRGPARWSVRATASTLNNEITSLPDPFIDDQSRWDVGRSRFDYYILRTAGVDPANGDQLFLDYDIDEAGNTVPVLNADGTQATTNDWQATEREYTGTSPIPDLIGSVSTNVGYRGFALDVLFNYSIGGEILDFGYAAMMHSGNFGNSYHPDILSAWRAPGDITDVPRLENGNPNLVRAASDRFLTDASFWSLRNVNLSYTFDSRLAERLGLGNVRVSLTGENLYLKSARDGLNPQFEIAGTPAGNTFSPARIVSAGLNVNF